MQHFCSTLCCCDLNPQERFGVNFTVFRPFSKDAVVMMDTSCSEYKPLPSLLRSNKTEPEPHLPGQAHLWLDCPAACGDSSHQLWAELQVKMTFYCIKPQTGLEKIPTEQRLGTENRPNSFYYLQICLSNTLEGKAHGKNTQRLFCHLPKLSVLKYSTPGGGGLI